MSAVLQSSGTALSWENTDTESPCNAMHNDSTVPPRLFLYLHSIFITVLTPGMTL